MAALSLDFPQETIFFPRGEELLKPKAWRVNECKQDITQGKKSTSWKQCLKLGGKRRRVAACSYGSQEMKLHPLRGWRHNKTGGYGKVLVTAGTGHRDSSRMMLAGAQQGCFSRCQDGPQCQGTGTLQVTAPGWQSHKQ